MTLKFKDFIPEVQAGFFSSTFEPLETTLEHANRWLARADVKVINVETVVMPDFEPGSSGARVRGRATSEWIQVIRVWYEA